MAMFFLDGFDVYGTSGVPITQELSERGWYVAGVECSLGESLHDATQLPLGHSLHLEGAGCIQHDTKNWLDTAIGLNIRLAAIPSGGPHALIQFAWGDGEAYVPEYTLCIENGHLASYSYGLFGLNAHKDGDINIPLQQNTRYTIHYYARRQYRYVWLNGVLVGYFGGYKTQKYTQAVYIHNPAAVGIDIDDLYLTYTNTKLWPRYLDSLYPMSHFAGTVHIPHCILTVRPIVEVLNQWIPSDSTKSLPTLITGDDTTYIACNALDVKEFGCKLEDAAFDADARVLRIQGDTRLMRTGSIWQLLHIKGVYNNNIVAYSNDVAPVCDMAHRVSTPDNLLFKHNVIETQEAFNNCEWYVGHNLQPYIHKQEEVCP